METPIEVLRVEQSVISKELSRFRACDPETRSLYCREWAQFIYKKHFVWNAKTQEEIVPESQPESHRLTAGKYQINFIHDEQNSEQFSESEPVFKKERSTLMSKKFEKLIESWSANPPQENEESLINQISSACELWITLPSGYSGLPVLFEPVEFNPFPDAIPLVDDEKDPSQLLDPLIIERQALCLPSDCFHLLKNLTGDILLSHTTPTCHHTRPESKQPGDLDTDRIIFNDHVQVAVKTALAELTLALEQAWHPLEEFLIKLRAFETRRIKLMGKGCQEVIDNYFKSQKYVSFVDAWTSQQSRFKNKKSTPEEIQKIDDAFIEHMDHLKSLVQDFLKEFVPNHLKEIHVLTTDLWKMIVPTIYEMGERMASHEDHKGNKNTNAVRIGESLKALDMESLKKMESTKEFEEAQNKIMEMLSVKVDAYMKEIDDFIKTYQESARPTVPGRLDKLGNKDFKKKIKKLESGYYSIRQSFLHETSENIFPEPLLCKFSLVCLEPLMQEGEVMEALTIEKEVKRFIESHKDLLQQRCSLIHDFEDGVQTGRRELAGILGKLFLKEGMRIQGDNLALKRQNSLLKSMGQAAEESSSKKRKNKKKTSAASSVVVSPTISDTKPEVELPAKKKVESTPSSPATPKKVSSPKVEVKKDSAPTKTTAPKAETKKPATSKMEPKKEPAPIAEVKKQPVAKVETKKEPTPKVEAKKVPTPKVEPKKVVTPKVEPKKEPTPKTEVKKEPTPKTEVKNEVAPKVETVSKVEPKAPTPIPQGNQEPVVQDWEALRAEFQKEEEEAKKKADPAPVGWSAIAKKAPETWSSAATAATSEASSMKEDETASPADSTNWSTAATGGWNTPVEKPKQEKPKKQEEQPKKADTWRAPAEQPKQQDTWNASGDVDLGGWGDASAKRDTNANWRETKKNTSTGWNEKAAKKAAVAGWGEDMNKEADISLGGWGENTTTKNEPNASTKWGSEEATKEEPKAANSWEEPKKVEQLGGWNNVSWEDQKEPIAEKQTEAMKPVGPPGMTASPNTAVPPVKNSVMPPGFVGNAANQISSPITEPTQQEPLSNYAAGMNGATQFHEPLPVDIQNMSADMLLLIVKNLHRENGTLIQSVYSLQQEMNMLTSRYSEIMGLAREREAQTLALFESRKQTEMEEVRRYVLSLEAKIKQLEEQNKMQNNLLGSTTAGFGNQDLFAGYREEMSSTTSTHHQRHQQQKSYRKIWQKNNNIRCGNCGEVGHSSGECKGFCRYCGSLEHLSELCPMN